MTHHNLVGRRVRLVRCIDPYTNLVPGAEGTIIFVDDMGIIHVNWDDGSRLGLIRGEDQFQILPEGSA